MKWRQWGRSILILSFMLAACAAALVPAERRSLLEPVDVSLVRVEDDSALFAFRWGPAVNAVLYRLATGSDVPGVTWTRNSTTNHPVVSDTLWIPLQATATQSYACVEAVNVQGGRQLVSEAACNSFQAPAALLPPGVPGTPSAEILTIASSLTPPAAPTNFAIDTIGDRWAEVVWDPMPDADWYAVWIIRSFPVELLERSGVPPLSSWTAPANADSISWVVTGDADDDGDDGAIIAWVAREGSCAYPVLRQAFAIVQRCRVEGLDPGVPYGFVVRAVRSIGAGVGGGPT